jgi:hypothetical protein
MLLLASCTASRTQLKVGKTDAGEVVEAEGMVPYNAGDMIATKRASLVDAQKNAVEKAVGVFVSGKTFVEKAVAIENNILAQTDGYIKKYDVMKEWKDGDFYHTKIRALVALKDLEKDLKEMSLLQAPELSRPRVLVKLTEKIQKETVEEKPAAAAKKKASSERTSAGRAPEKRDAGPSGSCAGRRLLFVYTGSAISVVDIKNSGGSHVRRSRDQR